MGRINSGHPGNSTAVGQHRKLFLGFGSSEGFWSELFWAESQAHRLAGAGPRRTQGCHHLDSAIHQFKENDPGLGEFSAN